jgi:Leucine-rich repeat (LRR) protein
MLVFTYCKFPMVKKIPLTLFSEIIFQLSYIGLPLTLGNINALMNKILVKSPSLARLSLEGNFQLYCRGLKNIRSCKSLTCLDLSRCRELGKKAMKYVADGCPQLQHLNVSGIPISDGMFRQILKCTNLKTLLMRNCDLTDIHLNLISTNVTSLLYLYIGPKFQQEDEVRHEMKRAMPWLVIKQASGSCDASEYYRIKRDLTHNVPF